MSLQKRNFCHLFLKTENFKPIIMMILIELLAYTLIVEKRNSVQTLLLTKYIMH